MKRFVILVLIIASIGVISCDMGTDPDTDNESPTVMLTNPADGDTVAGVVQVAAEVQDNQGVDTIKFYIDNQLREFVTAPAWGFSWDTAPFADSTTHTIQAEAVDAAGNIRKSDVISVLVYEESTDQPATVSFANDVQPIFNTNCTGCHGGNGGLYLTASESYSNLVNVESSGYAPLKRVVPSKPDSSVLYLKIIENPSTDVGQRMPQGGPYLSGEDISTILTWIEEGARDN